MTLQKVTLTGTRQGGDGSAASGTLNFAPSAVLTDITDAIGIDQSPVPAALGQAGTFTVSLYATDNAGFTMPWYWNVTECIAGSPPKTWSFYLAAANGLTQDISSLAAVTVESSPQSVPAGWTATVLQGSLAQRTFTLFSSVTTGAPYDLSGITDWEYVARPDASSDTALIDITSTAGSTAGNLTVTASEVQSQVLLTLYPAATQELAPGTYAHGLWSQPGTPYAFCWAQGSLTVSPVPQP